MSKSKYMEHSDLCSCLQRVWNYSLNFHRSNSLQISHIMNNEVVLMPVFKQGTFQAHLICSVSEMALVSLLKLLFFLNG